METAKFNYLGNAITFQRENGNVMANATEMAKPFGKQPSDWFRQKSTSEFLNALQAARGNPRMTDYVLVINGNTAPGTWVSEDVAMEFARWLSPVFAIWCNDRMKELLKYGATAVNPDDLLNPDFIIKLATELKTERARRELIEAREEAQREQLKLAAPKTQYFDEVLQSEALINTTVIAKELGMTANGLNKFLHEKGIVFLSGETWVLYAQHQNKGFTKTKTFPYTKENGEIGTRIHTYWTEKGRKAVHELVTSFKLNTGK